MNNKTEIARYTAIDMLMKHILNRDDLIKTYLLNGVIGLYNMNNKQLENQLLDKINEDVEWKIL